MDFTLQTTNMDEEMRIPLSALTVALTSAFLFAKLSFAQLPVDTPIVAPPITDPVGVDSETMGAGAEEYYSPAQDSSSQYPPYLQSQPRKPATNPCLKSHKGVYYDNDFSYLTKPGNNSYCLGDSLKRLNIGPCSESKLDVGGQLRLRYHHERGMGQQVDTDRFQNTDNDFLLERLRLYANYQATQNVRFYTEGIFADVSGESAYIPRGIDRNRGDLLNAFVDLKLTDSVTARLGRQELLYGNERTVSPLDWANTRRTFEGAKVMVDVGDWKIDAFFTHLVQIQPDDFDEADYDQPFYGAYGVYSGLQDATVDLYYLGYEHQRPGAAIQTDFSLHTIGARLNGKHGSWLYEFEGATQFGRQSGLGVDHQAYFATAGLGYQFADVSWKPTVWCYYDYASGNTPGGDFGRYNQLFPLAHKY